MITYLDRIHNEQDNICEPMDCIYHYKIRVYNIPSNLSNPYTRQL